MAEHDGAPHAPGVLGVDPSILLLLGVVVVCVGYVVAAHRTSRGGRPWPRSRTASFLVGTGLLLLALAPPISTYAHASFAGHMLQHLLLGMVAPIALVLGAPITLLLRSVGTPTGRRISQLLRSRGVHVLTRPATALLLSAGTLWLLYLTPLYNTTTSSPALHAALHLHFLLAGCLFAWVIAGPDPAPHRPSVNERLVTLGCAIVLHAALSQLLYADALVDVDAPIADLRAGATLMYYGGDVAELLLAVALLVTWRRRRMLAWRPRTRPSRTRPSGTAPSRRRSRRSSCSSTSSSSSR